MHTNQYLVLEYYKTLARYAYVFPPGGAKFDKMCIFSWFFMLHSKQPQAGFSERLLSFDIMTCLLPLCAFIAKQNGPYTKLQLLKDMTICNFGLFGGWDSRLNNVTSRRSRWDCVALYRYSISWESPAWVFSYKEKNLVLTCQGSRLLKWTPKAEKNANTRVRI